MHALDGLDRRGCLATLSLLGVEKLRDDATAALGLLLRLRDLLVIVIVVGLCLRHFKVVVLPVCVTIVRVGVAVVGLVVVVVVVAATTVSILLYEGRVAVFAAGRVVIHAKHRVVVAHVVGDHQSAFFAWVQFVGRTQDDSGFRKSFVQKSQGWKLLGTQKK